MLGLLLVHFLHHGLPVRERQAVYVAPSVHEPVLPPEADLAATLLRSRSNAPPDTANAPLET